MTAHPLRAVWRRLLSDRVVVDPRRAFPDAGSLATLSTQDGANLVDALRWGRRRAFRVRLLWFVVWALAGLLALMIWVASAASPIEWVQLLGVVSACVVFYGMEVAVLTLPARSLRREAAIRHCCLLLGGLEQEHSRWRQPSHIDRWILGLEATASEIENLTQSLGIRDSALRRRVADAMRGRAREIRELQLRMLLASDSDRAAVVERLTESLNLMIRGCWLSLPGSDLPAREPSLARRLAPRALPWLGVAAAIVVVGLVMPVGTASSVVTAIVGAVIVALLGRAGITTEHISKGGALVARDGEE